MARELKRRHHLVALKLMLRRRGRESVVAIELETHRTGKPEVRGEWGFGTSDLGLPRYLEAQSLPRFTLPAGVGEGIAGRVASLDLAPSQPIWLHLVKPYGYLGTVSWESLLGPVLQRPLLRLPDFLERPREKRGVLDVAVCCSAPLSEPAFYVPRVLGELIMRILTDSPRQSTKVDVFVDAQWVPILRSMFGADPRVLVHDPANPSTPGQLDSPDSMNDRTSSLQCPWLAWMRDAMRGRSLDTVHFVCHGFLADDRPAITVAESPLVNRDRQGASFVGVSDLTTFLTQTGAWCVAFTAPPNNYSPSGLRLLADTVAQARPGPVLFHELAGDPVWNQAGAAYRFLFSPRPSDPPRDLSGGFIYCQPALVEAQEAVARSPVLNAVAANASLFASEADDETDSRLLGRFGRAEPDVVPNWVAATQRFVEQVALGQQRRDANAARTSTTSKGGSDVVADTLNALQSIVGSYVRGTGGGSGKGES